MFTPQDIRQIEEHGLSSEQIERQMERFRTGFPYLNLARAAVAGDGIVRMDASEAERCRALYRSRRDERRIVKFVPASGAATRMFKSLFGFFHYSMLVRKYHHLRQIADRNFFRNGNYTRCRAL